MTYTCNTQGQGPRGRTRTTTFQDGWIELALPDGTTTRVPRLTEVTTPWLPIRCTIQQQAGMPPDPQCQGCENNPFDADRYCDTHCTWADHAPGCERS